MIPSVPRLALGLRAAGRTEFAADGVAAVVDVCGFTAMTATLAERGPGGAERVSAILAALLGPVAEAADSLGGDVVNFAGDAVAAFFPDGSAPDKVALALRAACVRARKADPSLPELRVAAASGSIALSIIEGARGSAWFAGGSALVAAYEIAERCKPGKALAGKAAAARHKGAPDPTGFGRYMLSAKQADDGASVFADADAAVGEDGFRRVLSAFVRPAIGLSGKDASSFRAAVLRHAETTGGYARYFDTNDKGLMALVVFGYPRMPDDPFRNAASFARGLADELGGGFAAGAAYGLTYAGKVGGAARHAHTCIGQTVNLACRLMQAAAPGTLLVPTEDLERWRANADGARSESVDCKGYDAPVSATALDPLKLPSSDASNARAGATGGGTMAGRDADGIAARFVGRQRELAELARSLAEGDTTVLHGPAGSGKTRLALEAIRNVGRIALRMAPDPVTKASLSGFASAVRDALAAAIRGTIDAPGTASEDLEAASTRRTLDAQAASAVAAILGLPDPSGLFRACEDANKAGFLARGMVALFDAANRAVPVALLFDDAHDFGSEDAALAKQLSGLVSRSDPRLPVIAASRDLERGFAPDGDAAVIDLVDLSPEETRELVAGLARAAGIPADGDTVGRVATASGGNPLFAEEAVRFVASREGASAGKDAGAATAIPDTVHDLVVAQVDSTGRASSRALKLGAVLGVRFALDELERFAKAAADEDDRTTARGAHAGAPRGTPGLASDGITAPDALSGAVRAGLLSNPDERAYLFRHVVVRDVVYGMVLGTRLAALHKLAASLLEPDVESDPSRWPELVRHAERSGDGALLERLLSRAAPWAEASWRNDEAIAWYGLLAERSRDADTRARGIRKRAELLSHVGRIDEATAAFRDAIDAARACADRSALPNALQAAAQSVMNTGDINDAEPVVAELSALVADGEAFAEVDREVACRALEALSVYFYYKGDFAEARRYAELQCARAGDAEDAVTAEACSEMAGLALADQRDKDEPLVWLDKGIALAKKVGDKKLIALCLYYYSVAYNRRCEFDQALRYCGEHMALASAIGDKSGVLYALARRGAVKLMMERFDEAIEDFTTLLREANASGIAMSVQAALVGLGNALYYSGRVDESLPYYLEHYAATSASGNNLMASITASAIGRAYHERGESERALDFFRKELDAARDVNDELRKGLAYGYIGMVLADHAPSDKALECLNYAIAKCSGFAVPCRTSRLYLEKARLYLERALTTTGLNDEAARIIHGLLDRAVEDAAKVNEPIVVDIPLQVRALKARVDDELSGSSRRSAASALIDETVPIRACDRALLDLERWRLSGDRDALERARVASPGLARRYVRWETRVRAGRR